MVSFGPFEKMRKVENQETPANFLKQSNKEFIKHFFSR